MLKSYLTIAWRNMRRQPLYTLLNLAGLTIGIAAALLILLYINFETNYDYFHQNADRIFKINTDEITTNSKVMQVDWQGTAGLIAPYLQQDFPEVAGTTRLYQFFNNEQVDLNYENKVITTAHLTVADSTALNIFTFDFIYGTVQGALDGPNKIVLSENLAIRIFGNVDPVGKIVQTKLTHAQPNIKSDYSLMVTGVYRDFPKNSHWEVDAMISSTTDPYLRNYYFNTFNFNTYVLLKDGVVAADFQEKIPSIYRNYLDPDREPVMKEAHHQLVPLRKIHMQATGGYTYIYIFSAIGFLMLLISMISYVNLVTAQASRRAMEIGVRKVMGSTQSQLIRQFLSESMVYSSVAIVIALGTMFYLIPSINTLLGLQLAAGQLMHPQVLLGLLAFLLLIGILGGSYPAFFLSSFEPITVLKGKLTKGSPLRRALVATQFGVVMIVLICTGMIYEQLQYMRHKDLGFNQDQVVHLEMTGEGALEKLPVLKNALKQSSAITSVGTASFLPGLGMSRRPISADNGESKEPQFVDYGFIDYDYFQTLDMDLRAGRNFSIDHPKDATESVVVNEQFAKAYGLDDPIGEHIRFGDSGNPNYETIVGVVKDFHSSTLHTSIPPQIFFLRPASYNLAVKINQNPAMSIPHIEETWRSIFPNAPFAYRFLDEDLAQAYETDQIRGKIFLLFSGITIAIAFLGLFGLVAYIARQRVKEIGIRRVLGASTWHVVSLLSKDFLCLVVAVAVPSFAVAWYFVQNWLKDYAYRAEMNYSLFLYTLLFVLGLTLLTTLFHALRATQLHPAKALKEE